MKEEKKGGKKSLHLLSPETSHRLPLLSCFSGYDKLLNSIYIICDLHYTDIVVLLCCVCHCHVVTCLLQFLSFKTASSEHGEERRIFVGGRCFMHASDETL